MKKIPQTRRSFIKRSSYTAAAITVLGTGAALGQGVSTTKKTDYVDSTASQDYEGEGEAIGDVADQAAVEEEAKDLAMLDLAIKSTTGSSHVETKDVPTNHELKSIISSAIPPDPPGVDGVIEVSVVSTPLPFNRVHVSVKYKLSQNSSTRLTIQLWSYVGIALVIPYSI